MKAIAIATLVPYRRDTHLSGHVAGLDLLDDGAINDVVNKVFRDTSLGQETPGEDKEPIQTLNDCKFFAWRWIFTDSTLCMSYLLTHLTHLCLV